MIACDGIWYVIFGVSPLTELYVNVLCSNLVVLILHLVFGRFGVLFLYRFFKRFGPSGWVQSIRLHAIIKANVNSFLSVLKIGNPIFNFSTLD